MTFEAKDTDFVLEAKAVLENYIENGSFLKANARALKAEDMLFCLRGQGLSSRTTSLIFCGHFDVIHCGVLLL
jgi:hypothetical protein